MRNMSTYSNVKMGEIFAIYGNPFSRRNCYKNFTQVLCIPYTKKIDFTAVIKYIPGGRDQEPQNLKDTLQIMTNKIQIQSKQFDLGKKTTLNNPINIQTNMNSMFIDHKVKSNEEKRNNISQSCLHSHNNSAVDNVIDLKRKPQTTREVSFIEEIKEIIDDR